MPDHRSTRPRLIALLLVVAIATGLATTVVSAAPALPACRVADVLTKYGSYGHWPRSLLDSTYRLSSLYKPGDLRNTSLAGLNGGLYVRSIVIADLKSMAYAARNAGARLAVQSAFRSYATQKATFDYWVRVHGYAVALKESARAGHSEHQLGTTIDFKSYGGKAPWDYTDWGTSAAGRWLKANAWKYGFVMSYPKDKTPVTCYTYEPWHYRYVGRAQAAALRASQVTLREFLWGQQNPTVATPSPSPSASPSASPPPAP
jgi:D-alanyl-D-alanine carboxypeptidase